MFKFKYWKTERSQGQVPFLDKPEGEEKSSVSYSTSGKEQGVSFHTLHCFIKVKPNWPFGFWHCHFVFNRENNVDCFFSVFMTYQTVNNIIQWASLSGTCLCSLYFVFQVSLPSDPSCVEEILRVSLNFYFRVFKKNIFYSSLICNIVTAVPLPFFPPSPSPSPENPLLLPPFAFRKYQASQWYPLNMA